MEAWKKRTSALAPIEASRYVRVGSTDPGTVLRRSEEDATRAGSTRLAMEGLASMERESCWSHSYLQ